MKNKKKTVKLSTAQVYTRDDYIVDSLKDLREAIRDLKDGQKELRTELNGRCDKIEDDIKDIRNEMRAMLRHSQILTASVVGFIVAVIFSMLR